jgi:metallo-beta-lactamase family protein
MESLYGGIEHESRDTNIRQLLNIIIETYSRSGSVYIPIFSLHRAQEILNIFHSKIENDSELSNIQFYLDSPMAKKITNVYLNNLSLFNDNFINSSNFNKQSIKDYFNFPNLKIIKKSKQSFNISNKRKSVIIAGSGMADGGRIIKHLYNNLENPSNSVIFVGYQAEGTLGNKLINNIKEVKIQDKLIKVNSNIYYLRGFSAHADHSDLKTWLNKFNLSQLKTIFLTHAEKERIEDFQSYLNNSKINSIAPEMFEIYNVD